MLPDWALVLIVLVLVVAGLVFVSTATDAAMKRQHAMMSARMKCRPEMVPAVNKRRMMMKDEMAIEAEIKQKGLNAPRLTPTDIDGAILAEQYHVFPGTTLTVCCLTLRNGFTVTGESAAASPENFDTEIGRKIARENARNKIWPLEGYRLRQSLFEQSA